MLKSRELDYTNGSILKNLILTALPLAGINILQLLFTATDVAVLGIFTNDHAVAAVGATTSITNMLTSFFVGISVGANILLAKAKGAKDSITAKRLVGTSVLVGVAFGALIMIAGILLAEKLLILTNCDAAVLPYAKKYLQIYFIGMPIIMLYNFSAAILRAVGDAMRPLIFLAIGGVANIILNIIFIVVFGLDVEGVAIATVISKLISASGALYIMKNSSGYAKIEAKDITFDFKIFGKMMYIGLPMGLSKLTFSLSNTLVASAINALGPEVMTANSIGKEFDAMILEALHAISLAAISIISQNLGAKNIKRIKKTIFSSIFLNLSIGVVLGALLLIFGRFLAGIMTDSEEVISLCMVRFTTVGAIYFICGLQSIALDSMRALGFPTVSLILTLISNVALRFVWILFVYPLIYIEGDISMNLAKILSVFPMSWILVGAVGFVLVAIILRKLNKKLILERENETSMPCKA